MGLELALRQKITISYFLREEGNYIQNCLSTIAGLTISFSCTQEILASQNSYGFTAIIYIAVGGGGVSKKVASNLLKIGQLVAYG